MKRIILTLLTVISLASCSIDSDDSITGYYEFLPITDAEVPAEFIFGEKYEIKILYTLPNSCYLFNNVYYDYQDTSRVVAVNSYVLESASCMEKTTEMEHTFIVHCLQEETYSFKFWQGEDADGNNQYLIVDVPVIK